MGANNEQELQDMIKGSMQSAINFLMDEIIEKNRDAIERFIYSGSFSDYGGEYDGGYQQTGEFKEAWSAKEESYGNIGGAEFYYDKNEIITFGRPNLSPPQHESLYGQNMAEYLADLIYQGHGGAWSMPARNAFEQLDKTILTKSKFRELFQEGMTRAGIKWKRSNGSPVKTEFNKL